MRKRTRGTAAGRRIAAGQEGQSTLEFALTLLLLMGFVLFYLQLSLMMAFGNYVHYATFMAARAYLSAGPTREDQEERARQVITRMLKKGEGLAGADRFPSIGKGAGGGSPAGLEVERAAQFDELDPRLSWMQGVRYSFKSRLFLLPMGRGPGSTAEPITLKSESWLGREPAYDECKLDLKEKKGIFDNGC